MYKPVFNSDDAIIQRYTQLAYELKRLDQLLERFLAPELAAHCHVANFRKGILVIAVTTATFATPLRFAVPELLTRFRNEGKLYQLRSIETTVIPSPRVPAVHKNSGLVTSISKAKLEELASRVKDSDLQAAIMRLSSHIEGTS